MMPKNGYNYDHLKTSLERALNILGDSSKQNLMVYMKAHCGISFESGRCSITEIENALHCVFGSGATIITERMYRELQTLPE
jgi:hypothetical protein